METVCSVLADERPIFGVPLAVAVARNKSCDGIALPAMFRECIDYIEEFGWFSSQFKLCITLELKLCYRADL